MRKATRTRNSGISVEVSRSCVSEESPGGCWPIKVLTRLAVDRQTWIASATAPIAIHCLSCSLGSHRGLRSSDMADSDGGSWLDHCSAGLEMWRNHRPPELRPRSLGCATGSRRCQRATVDWARRLAAASSGLLVSWQQLWNTPVTPRTYRGSSFST